MAVVTAVKCSATRAASSVDREMLDVLRESGARLYRRGVSLVTSSVVVARFTGDVLGIGTGDADIARRNGELGNCLPRGLCAP